jgi:hypothetical protein
LDGGKLAVFSVRREVLGEGRLLCWVDFGVFLSFWQVRKLEIELRQGKSKEIHGFPGSTNLIHQFEFKRTVRK